MITWIKRVVRAFIDWLPELLAYIGFLIGYAAFLAVSVAAIGWGIEAALKLARAG